ncbi:zinc finger BED domain-containing protein RICESLEEPER 2-like [Rhizophagus irregularis DAOM 181602=DAOM 197198]|nr:zinc finger BED domain-containing protein RICESLEEPER 2-like [Rhizophagus irregularis DAOM 181602=DAOM 197198]
MPSLIAWTKIKETIIVLEPLKRATKNLSDAKYPTIADVRFYFNEIQDHLKYCMESDQYFKVPRSRTSIPKENNNVSGREYFYQLKKWRLGETTKTAQASTPPSNNPDFTEIERYLALPCNGNVEVLLWWQAHTVEFPVLSLMARDYLAIQSTSVACEQAFSVAGNTITKTQNRLQPETVRASLCAKNWIDNNIGEKNVA